MIDPPKTKQEAQLRRYRNWAGNPHGNPFDPSRCAYSVPDGGRSCLFHQCFSKPGKGPEGLYCGTHAKKVRKAKEEVMSTEPKLLYSHLGKCVYIVTRYQDKGNGVIVAQRKYDVTHQFDQVRREINAYKEFPAGCQCSETNGAGDCDWCREYYGGE